MSGMSRMSGLSIWLALLEISGFGKGRKKIYIDDTCELQVMYARRKENNQRRGWRGCGGKDVVAPFCKIGKDEIHGYKDPR
jgi:hypothetical protein